MTGDVDGMLALARAPGLHLDALRAAGHAADPLALLGKGVAALRALGMGEAAARWLSQPDAALVARDREWLARSGARLVTCDGPGYPPLLHEVASAPVALYVLGDAQALLAAQLAIVGSRNPTASGARTAREFSAWLARTGLVITSGLAVGIDAAAHEGALAAKGRTVAVLGCGLDAIYPSENAGLAARIAAAGGAVASEFPPGTPPLRENFPRRNRIISGLSLGTLVVEAARHSGSLITARLAAAQGREVFAIPGSIHNPLARGCHELLRSGAKLIESAPEVLAELKIPFTKQEFTEDAGKAAGGAEKPPRLDNDYEILLDALAFEPESVDALVERTGLAASSLASMLLILELEGRVELHAGGRYSKVG